MPGIVNMIEKKKNLWLGISLAPRENVLLMFCQTDMQSNYFLNMHVSTHKVLGLRSSFLLRATISA